MVCKTVLPNISKTILKLYSHLILPDNNIYYESGMVTKEYITTHLYSEAFSNFNNLMFF